jgi:hypothetical protein
MAVIIPEALVVPLSIKVPLHCRFIKHRREGLKFKCYTLRAYCYVYVERPCWGQVFRWLLIGNCWLTGWISFATIFNVHNSIGLRKMNPGRVMTNKTRQRQRATLDDVRVRITLQLGLSRYAVLIVQCFG